MEQAMLGNILEILFVLGFAATIVAVVAVAFALVVPSWESFRRGRYDDVLDDETGAEHI
jgi:hypothetical protein